MSTTSDVDLNPHDLCTWNDEVDCENCRDKDLLFCKFDKKTLTAFLFLFLPFFTMSFFALVVAGVLTGIWWGRAVANLANGLLFALWFRRGKWKERVV